MRRGGCSNILAVPTSSVVTFPLPNPLHIPKPLDMCNPAPACGAGAPGVAHSCAQCCDGPSVDVPKVPTTRRKLNSWKFLALLCCIFAAVVYTTSSYTEEPIILGAARFMRVNFVDSVIEDFSFDTVQRVSELHKRLCQLR